MAVVLAYLFYFVAASASPLQRRWLSTKKVTEGKSQTDFAFKVMLIVSVLSLLIPFFQPAKLSGSLPYLVFLSLSSGLFGAGFFISSYIAQKHVDAGITTLISNIYTPITIVLAILLLHEGLNAKQIVGTILLLIAMVIVAKKHKTGKFTFDKYFLLMILSGVFLGINLTAERALQIATGFTAGTMLSWWSQCLFLGLFSFLTNSKSQYNAKDTTITGVLRFFQALSWVLLLFIVGNLSIVSAVTTFKVVVVFLAAALLLNEREDMGRKIFGSLIAVAGLLMMS